MKKFLSTFFLLGLVAFSGCDSSQSNQEDSQAPETTQAPQETSSGDEKSPEANSSTSPDPLFQEDPLKMLVQ